MLNQSATIAQIISLDNLIQGFVSEILEYISCVDQLSPAYYWSERSACNSGANFGTPLFLVNVVFLCFPPAVTFLSKGIFFVCF